MDVTICPNCNGTGAVQIGPNVRGMTRCPYCGGSGEILQQTRPDGADFQVDLGEDNEGVIKNDDINMNKIPELTFFGLGSAFNTKNGHTSAFLKIKENILFLFDVTEDTTRYIIENPEILNKVTDMYIFITHFHPDHVSGLGNLLFYIDYAVKHFIGVTLVTGTDTVKHRFTEYLKMMCIPMDSLTEPGRFLGYRHKCVRSLNDNNDIIEVIPVKNNSHCDDAYYFYIIWEFETPDGGRDYRYAIYTGDTQLFPPCYKEFDYDKCERIYIDCSTEKHIDGGVHYSIENICKACDFCHIPYSKITPMHFESDAVEYKACKLFSYPNLIKNGILDL